MVKPISPAENGTVPLLTDVMKQFENFSKTVPPGYLVFR